MGKDMTPTPRIRDLRPLLSLSGLLAVCIGGLFYLAYRETFQELSWYWFEGYNWQFLVPIAFVYMLWERRDLFSALQTKTNIVWGAPLLLLGCSLLIVGQLSSTHSLREISLIVSLFGLVLLIFGTSYVKKLFWPLAYLGLMTSLPSDLLDNLRYPMKLLSATVAAEMLTFFGYSVFRQETILQLPHIVLEVADSCSGLNQMMSAFALGIPIAFTLLNSWWKRLAIILLACLSGLVMNWLRVFLIAIWHYHSAKETIHGPHGIYGLPFIFLVGVFFTYMVATAIAGKNDSQPQRIDQAASNPDLPGASRKRTNEALLVAVLCLSATALYLGSWRAEPVYLSNRISDFPNTVAGFSGTSVEKLDEPFPSQLAQNELIRRYTNATGETAILYIGYFYLQNQEKELIDYRYDWLHEDATAIELPSSSGPAHMKKKRVKTSTGSFMVYFFYDINGRNIIDRRMVKLANLVDALLKRRTNGAIVIILFENPEDDLSKSEREFLMQVFRETSKRLHPALTRQSP
jgi:EpsI family protein